jgi:hypothetical protein
MQVDEMLKLLVVGGGFTATGYVTFRWMMAWLRRFEQRTELLAGAGRPHEDVARLAALEGHVAELQERLDFAERLLARQSEPERLGR